MNRHFDSVTGDLPQDPLRMRMGGLCEAILDKALPSVWDHDDLVAEVAKDDLEIDRLDVAIDEDDVVDDLQDEVVRDTLRGLEIHPQGMSHDVDVIMVAKNLERVADHATNIAEQVILVAEAKNLKHASKLVGIGSGS